MKISQPKCQDFFSGILKTKKQEAWGIIGSNLSGIDTVFEHLCEQAPSAGIVSFKKQQETYESEPKKDETDLLDRIDPGTPARAFLTNIDAYSALMRTFDQKSANTFSEPE